MKKALIIIWSLVAIVLIFFSIMYIVTGELSNDLRNLKDPKRIEKIESYLEEGNYKDAYREADKLNSWDKKNLYNDRILKTELSSLIEGSEEDSNYAQILFAINERGDFIYGGHGVVYCPQYDYVIEMAGAIGNNELADKFKELKKEKEREKN